MSTLDRVRVVSPQFPCGAAWLANALLELRVPIEELWGFPTALEWTAQADGSVRYTAEHRPWQQTLAALYPGRCLRFRARPLLQFSHAFPWQLVERRPTILMVRDPRDALYSEWQRHRRNRGLADEVGFPSFMHSPFEGGPASQADALWLHLAAWLVAPREHAGDLLLVRFEDCKRSPEAALGKVLDWLGVRAGAGEIRRAIQSSDVRRLQRVEATLHARDTESRQFNRRGMAEEWRTTWKSHWLDELDEPWDVLLRRLDYSPLPPRPAIGDQDWLRPTLEWLGLQQPEAVAGWLAALLRFRDADPGSHTPILDGAQYPLRAHWSGLFNSA